jgi:Flp pilus assembly protein protease CpaA
MSIATLLFASGMLAAAVSDLARRRIPNWMNITILIAGLVTQAASGGLGALGHGLAGAGVGLLLLLPLFKVRWLGGGDVKLACAMGAWLGPTYVFWATAIGMAGGGLLALYIALSGGAAFRQEIRVNLANAALSMSLPDAPRRAPGQLVPVAVALGGAAIGVFLARGGV